MNTKAPNTIDHVKLTQPRLFKSKTCSKISKYKSSWPMEKARANHTRCGTCVFCLPQTTPRTMFYALEKRQHELIFLRPRWNSELPGASPSIRGTVARLLPAFPGFAATCPDCWCWPRSAGERPRAEPALSHRQGGGAPQNRVFNRKGNEVEEIKRIEIFLSFVLGRKPFISHWPCGGFFWHFQMRNGIYNIKVHPKTSTYMISQAAFFCQSSS